MSTSDPPPIRGYRRPGGRPGLNVDYVAVCDAVATAKADCGETMNRPSVRSFVGLAA